MTRALSIALAARLYGLLADRPEFSGADRDERINATSADALPIPMSDLDAVLVTRARELDRLCGYAVRLLRRKGTRPADLLDVLGALDPDRLLAIYYALPADRRHKTLADGVWSYYVTRAPDGIDAALAETESATDSVAFFPGGMIDWRREARRYRAGLPHNLAPGEVVLIEVAPSPSEPRTFGEALRAVGAPA